MTNYFKFSELIESQKAESLGIKNIPNWEQIESLKALVDNVLNPLREALGRPIYINSGFRTPELNEAIGGARNSQHIATDVYAAVDLDCKNKNDNKKMYELLRTFDIDQCINEHEFEWIHVSYRLDNKNRHQYLKIIKKNYNC